MEEPESNVSWEIVQQKGNVPKNISHHRPAVFGQHVIVFGGLVDGDDNPNAYEFDSVKGQWSHLKQTGDVPKPRDDHSLAQIDDNSFLIFGGFVEGSRTNECFIGKRSLGQIEWKQVAKGKTDGPSIRASQSAVCHNGKCYIFGGMSDDNIKLNDLWELDLATETYTEIKLGDKSFQPLPRSGHTASIHNGKMIIFGGILELTKELNEMLLYDFGTKCFTMIGETHNEDLNALQQSNNRVKEEDASPLQRRGTLKKNQLGQQMSSASPTKLGAGSPSKLGKSPTLKLEKAKRRPPKQLSTAGGNDAGPKEKKESGLGSPMSIKMQSSFIIKNADESFDAYYQTMKKRKLGGTNMDGTMGLSGTSPSGPNDSNFGVVKGIRPAARDGHTTVIQDGLMFVFGGDRHLMPFNDLYLMNLGK